MSTSRADYYKHINDFRDKREAALRAKDSWLSLTGLYWLQPGLQMIGSDPRCEIVLPASAPGVLGTLEWRDKSAKLVITADADVQIDGVSARSATLIDNSHGARPTLVTCGTITFFVHTSGDNYAIRVKDSTHPAIDAFVGCVWFPVKPDYRIKATYVPHSTPRAMPVTTLVNTIEEITHTGQIEFELQGRHFSLVAGDSGSAQRVWIILRDTTAGHETYAACRFLYVDINPDGTADLDFNKAINPPCAFTLYATCPLPPKENILDIRIEAGELDTQHN